MRVEVIDLKTGKSKFMPEKHAKVLVRLKRARWPVPVKDELVFTGTEDPRTIYDVDAGIKADNADITPTDEVDNPEQQQNPEQQPVIIRRGRKPKSRG